MKTPCELIKNNFLCDVYSFGIITFAARFVYLEVSLSPSGKTTTQHYLIIPCPIHCLDLFPLLESRGMIRGLFSFSCPSHCFAHFSYSQNLHYSLFRTYSALSRSINPHQTAALFLRETVMVTKSSHSLNISNRSLRYCSVYHIVSQNYKT